MTGLVKGLAVTAPALLVVFAASWFLNRETTTELRADEAAFDRDFAFAQSQMARTPQARDYYSKAQTAAQQRYSSARADFEYQKQNVDRRDKEINAGIDQAESDLMNKKLEERRK